jgi:WD40 repeat protein
MDLVNYAEKSPFAESDAEEQTLEDLTRWRAGRFITCYFFHQEKVYTGYEDGLICAWDQTGGILEPLLGHTARINCFEAISKLLIVSGSNDRTIRKWNTLQNTCLTIIKFDEPISNSIYESSTNLLHVCTWDKYIRAVDMETHKVKNAFMCSKETVRCIHLAGNFLFVAGSDPIIRRFDTLNAAKENQKLYNGHKGWVN